MERKFKQHVKPFKLWESENFSKGNMLNEKTELTDEQLKDYESAYFYIKVLSSPENFSKLITHDTKSWYNVYSKLSDMMKGATNWSSTTREIFRDFVYLCLKSVYPDFKIEPKNIATTKAINWGYSRTVKTTSASSFDYGLLITDKKGNTAQLNLDDLINRMSEGWINDTALYKDENIFTLSKFTGETLNNSEIKKRIISNFNNALNKSPEIKKSIQNAEKLVNSGEKEFMTSIKRTVQNFLGGWGF